MYSTTIENRIDRENRYKAIKFLAIIAITAMMAIPIIQHIQNEYASTPVESYSYHNEMVRFVGSNAFIGFDGNMFPVSWHVFEANPNYSPGPQVNPFAVSTNNTNTSAPLIEETFSNYTTKRIESVWQNSAVMIKWNHYVKIAEIFSFTNNGIDASIVVKNLNVTNTYISTFSLGMGVNSTMNVNGFNPSCQNISSGTGLIPSSDWNVSVGNISVNWQSEDSIFHSGIVSETSLGDQIILPFETGVINHNQSYTIDPMIYYSPYRIIGNPIHLPSPTPSPININSGSTYDVSFVESGLPSGTPWYVSMGGSTLTSATNTITFSKKVGTYSYSIGSPSGYPSNPSSGNVIVFDSSRSIGIAFSAYPYNVTFDESGLTSGTSWSATLNGNTQSSTTSTIIFSEYYGYYSYNIGSVSGYSNSPSGTGHIMVKEDSAPISVEYTMLPKPHLSDINITQSGLPSGVSWSATLNGNTQSSTTSTITFSVYNGTYSYCIGSVSGYTRTLKSGSITVNGASQSISETYSPIANDVTFFESGLPNGTVWSVNLNGNTISTSSSISFSEHDGSYSYSIGSMLGYVISPSSGTATINGDSSTVSVTFTRLLGEIGVGYQLYGNTKTQNLLDYITNTSNEGFTYNNAMLGGTLSNITFSIPYFDANMGSGHVNTYTSINNPTVSPDEISGPPQGNSGSPFRGMLIYTLTSSGSVGFPIYCNQNLNGNGVVSFSWTTQPGAYGGFMVELVNNNTYAQSYYKHPFDVYSRLVNSAFSSCIGDSAAYTSIYSSSGVYIGNLVITASEGPSSYDCKYNTYIPFGLTTVFTSPDNNVGSNEYTYGILNYNQYLNYTGTQYGKSNSTGLPVYNPICALNQGSSPSNNTNSSTGIAAEEAIYDLTDNVLLLSTDPCLMAIGLTMVALGPFVFPGTAPSESNSQSYWNKPVSQAGISYGSLPQVNQIEVGCGITLGDPLSYPLLEPMFKILNNGNGNLSYMQFLNMILQQQPKSNLTKNDNQFTLDYFTYSASETIVPIIHSYTFHPCVEPCGEYSSRTQTYDFTQNDYVVATPNGNGGYTYNGPSYTGAVSLQLYIPLEG